MKRLTQSAIGCSVVFLVVACLAGSAHAGTFTWTQLTSGGLWSDTANWAGSVAANGDGNTADFSTLNITADNTVHLDTPVTIGNLLFGDTSTGSFAGWVLDNDGNSLNILTLADTTPTITVNNLGSNKVAAIGAEIAGSSGLTKAGLGALTLNGAAVNSYTGDTTVNRGTLIIDFANLDPATNLVNSASTLVLGSGTLQVKQKTASVTSQTFNGTTINAGASSITAPNVGGSVTNTLTVDLGAITRNTGGVASFSPPSNGQGSLTTSTTNDASGILGTWAITGSGASMQYAATDGSGGIAEYTGATVADPNLTNVTSDTTNYEFAAAATIADGSALIGHTLRYTGGSAALEIGADANNTNTLTLNGIMQAGSNTLTIQDTGENATGGLVIGANNELVIVANNKNVTISAPIKDGAAAGSVTYSGASTLTLTGENTYSGGTTVASGRLSLLALVNGGSNSALGTGPVTVMRGAIIELSRNDVANSLTLNDATLRTGNSYPSYWLGPITLIGNATFGVGGTGHLRFTGDISGPGGFTLTGTRRDINGINHTSGTNTYAGTTTIAGAIWQFDKRVSLYNANQASWTAENLTVASNATCIFSVGGAGEFTSSDIDILASLGTDTGGFMDGSFLGLDTANASGSFEYGGVISDTNANDNSIGLRVLANRPLVLSGENTYTGPTQIYTGTVSVSSINSVVGGAASSSLGAPTTEADGTIQIGYYYNNASLVYTGPGETTDRAINLLGYNGIVIDQSGAGLLKFTSDMLSPRTGVPLTLQGSTAGKGEFAGAVAGASTNRLVKNGTGTWTLSGTSLYTGTTTINAGTLRVTGSIDTSDVTVRNTGTLSGGGSVKSLVVETGGTVAPGNSVGTLTVVDGNTSLGAGAIYEWEFDGVGGDLVDANGNLSLDDTWILKLIDAGGTPNGTLEYDLFTYSGDYTGLGSFGLANIDVSEVTWDTASATITDNGVGRVFITGIGPSALAGDADGDGDVDAADYIVLKSNIGMATGAVLADGDFNEDGAVDWADLQILQDHYGESLAGAPGTIPEPATLGLLTLGAMALLRRRRRS